MSKPRLPLRFVLIIPTPMLQNLSFLCAGRSVLLQICDNVWTFVLNNVHNSVGSGGHKESIIVKSVKIVACDGKNTFGLDIF